MSNIKKGDLFQKIFYNIFGGGFIGVLVSFSLMMPTNSIVVKADGAKEASEISYQEATELASVQVMQVVSADHLAHGQTV